jgi:hypothetical protein
MDWEAEFTRGSSSSATLVNSNKRSGGASSSRPNAMPSLIDRARSSSAMAIDEDDEDTQGFRSSSTAVNPGGMALDIGVSDTPLEQLMRHWLNERHSPEILPAQDVLLGNLLDHVRRQVLLVFCRYVRYRRCADAF